MDVFGGGDVEWGGVVDGGGDVYELVDEGLWGVFGELVGVE